MNLFNLANFKNPKNIYTVRTERVKREGSPYYTWQVPVTATTATAVIGIREQFPDARKYEPLDWLEIVNNEAVNNLTLRINGTETFAVPAGTIRTISNAAVWHIGVTNDGGVNTTLGLIVVTLQKQPLTIDKWARKNG